ncbi:MAG: T9SS type A sorting domain-containing protein [Lishizhenia sp.]
MIKVTFLILLLNTFYSFAQSYNQTGTISDPFVSLHQAAAVTTAGIYYFDFSGNTFNTYVDANGFVQVAIDFGNGVGNLPQETSLTTTTRGILNPTILERLNETVQVRISSSTGNINVTSTDPTIISRVRDNYSLHRGSVDNGINNHWTGTNSGRFTVNGGCMGSSPDGLHQKIIHICGSNLSFNWIPYNNLQRERYNFGEVADGVFFQLWVKGDAALIAVLPIELLNFNATAVNSTLVELNWQTASEINNGYFTVERSKDGNTWEVLEKIDGAGSSSSLLNYSTKDLNPYRGISYYRLKQTDFDGEYSYSPIRSVNSMLENNQFNIYPNPTNSAITIEGKEAELKRIKVYNVLGEDVTGLTQITDSDKTKLVIDLSQLKSGIYYIKTKTTTKRLYKQ